MVPPAPKVPAKHTSHVAEVPLPTTPVPGVQDVLSGVQEDAPGPGVVCPTGHTVHTLAPGLSLYWPTGHGTHTPAIAKVPAKQGTQARDPTMLI